MTKGIKLMIFSLMLSLTGILTVQFMMMYLFTNTLSSKPKVKIGIAKGRKLEYMKQRNICTEMTATSVGKSKGNMMMVLLAYFWIYSLYSLPQHIFITRQSTNLRFRKVTASWIKGLTAEIMKKLMQQGETTAYQSRSKSLNTEILFKSRKEINDRQVTLLNLKISPFSIIGTIVVLIKLEISTLTQMKLNYSGRLSGLSSLSAIMLTITISRMLVTVETKEAEICTTLVIRMSVSMVEQQLAMLVSSNMFRQLALQKQNFTSFFDQVRICWAYWAWAWARVVSALKSRQLEVLVTYRVHRAISDDVMKMATTIKTTDKMALQKQLKPLTSILSHLIISGLGSLVDSSKRSSLPFSLSLRGQLGMQHNQRLNLEPKLLIMWYLLHLLMKSYLAAMVLKWTIAQMGSKFFDQFRISDSFYFIF